jgi:IS30 family transposase
MIQYTTILEKCYTHFSRDEREEIAIGREQRKSLREIASSLGRSPSSVNREIRRNTPPCPGQERFHSTLCHSPAQSPQLIIG